MPKLSGLQRDVLSLYRRCLRACRQKPAVRSPRRAEFERNAALEKRDFGAIEYVLRRGRRQLDIYEDPGIRNIST
ncbi:complex 1 protein-like protein [Saccharata proteae CBS 121410]|uniref:Complex 1 protein-like protein n=1 Tax=Saccharata proteae CBS 121410 TaxID=1314787 RepID=A0A9P4LZ43_9PEZI|nr:complex 1 protein-like protein [Saccharata proteae CBS 121410]